MRDRQAGRIKVLFFFLITGVATGSCPRNGQVVEEMGGRGAGAVGEKPQPAEKGRPLQEVEWTGKPDQGWKEFDRLTNEQKYEQASKLAEDMLEKAKTTKSSEAWVRALIRYVQLRTALHGYETSVRFLREQPWPEDLLGSSVLHLFYGRSLVNYAQVYSWEIRKRERVESKGAVDLKAWTLDQIYAEAQRAFHQVYKHREQLGAHPVGDFGEYLTPNSYPREIRGTLRDTVSYLFAELLVDTSGWQPEHSNQIYQLDLGMLLGEVKAAVSPLDPGVHPLLNVCAVLDDLETWHAQKKEQEAAFEARLVRLSYLHTQFTQQTDRERIKKDLKERLAGMRRLAWWSMGMATLAEFVQAEDAPDSLIRAHTIAREGNEAYPRSIGGQRCLHIVKSIEVPDFNLEGMTSDAPGKPSVGAMYKNLDKLYFRAYRVDLKAHIERSDDLFPDYQALANLVRRAKPSHRWEAVLAPTPDFRMHRMFSVPPMKKPGFYVVMASARKDFSKERNKIQAVNMVVGDLVLTSRQEGAELEVEALSGSEGRPVAGVRVYLYRYDYHNNHHSVDSKTTGRDGMVRFLRSDSQWYFVFAQKGQQVAIDPNHLHLDPRDKPAETRATLLYTDRSIYRPQQTLHFKAVVYQGRYDKGNFRTAPGTRVSVSLMDANHQEVAKKKVTTNSYGTASGEFVIPAGRLLGQWQLRASPEGSAVVRVEAYKRPTFEAKILDPQRPLRLNQEARLKGEARYYFGLPVTSGKVRWRVVRTPVVPWWWSYYWWRTGGGGSSRTQAIGAGTAELRDDGTFEVRFVPEADERLAEESRELTYRYTLTAEVTDEGGETRSASRSFRLGFVAVEAAVTMETSFFMEDRPFELEILRTDLDGVAKPGKGSYRLVALAQPDKALRPVEQPLLQPPGKKKANDYATADDRKRTRWNPRYQPEGVLRGWVDGTERARGNLTHDKEGKAKVKVSGLAAGAYRVHYTTQDAFGAKYTTSREFVVAGRQGGLALPGYLQVESASVKVGGTARVLAVSGLLDQLMILDVYRDGKRIERRVLTSGRDETLIEIPVTEKLRGGFGVTLAVLSDHQFMTFTRSVFVPWDNKELKVAFSTFRDLLRPGQKETWSVKVTRPAGKDAAVPAAEVLAYMYDRSLDAFCGHHPPSPLSVFPGFTRARWVRASLGPARISWVDSHGFPPPPDYPHLQADVLKFFSRYGIGGLRRRIDVSTLVTGERQSPLSVNRKQIMVLRASKESPMVQDQTRAPAPEREKDGEARRKIPSSDEHREEAAAGQVELRTDFSETAFFQPHLLTGDDGSVTFQFTVPDSVTSWNVWVHAVTRDLASGSVKKESRTVKDLMVRPYLPRFLREGDTATLKVVVNNASETQMKGELTFDIIDPDTHQSILADFGLSRSKASRQPFSVKAGAGTNLSFDVKTPARLGLIAFKVIATSGEFSDGELRPIPVLPGRMHLAQSRFVTLRDKVRREMRFEDLATDDDPSLIHEQMVVTVDAQLFYSVLSALPYLVNYPYECTEQTLNRFISTGILASMYGDYPAIERMAKKFAQRKQRYETWDAADPNRKMALEETPWLQMARGGPQREHPLINVLDPRLTRAERDASLIKLKKAQTSSGGFPWFPGGPPSPYMTLYILYGFSKGLEFGVEVPRDMIHRAWRYMHRHYIDELVQHMLSRDCCWEFITFLNYVLSNYPDTSWTGGVFSELERKKMLAFSFGHWREHSPYLKGYLALTLKRMDRRRDAILVWESVMDSARTREDQGTFWAPEDRGWLWYNDTIETHAFAIRTVMELVPKSEKLDGLVLWIFLNKKLNHWKSTRATAEVVYSLAHYLKKTAQLGIKEEIKVTAGDVVENFVFEPDEYTGKKNQVVIPGEKVDANKHALIVVEKETRGFALASATWHFSTERLPSEARGDYLAVTRKYFKRVKTGREVKLLPLEEGAEVEVGDEVEVQLALTTKHAMEYVHLRDPRPAGFEPVSHTSRHKWNLGIYWYEEIRDSGTNFFFEKLPQGNYPFNYRLRAATAGTFKAAPAFVQPMYAPEFTGYSSGKTLTITPSD